jgi:hypothetical protein
MKPPRKTWKIAFLFLIGLSILLAILRSSKSKPTSSPARSLPPQPEPEPLRPLVQTIPTPIAAESVEIIPEPELTESVEILPANDSPVPAKEPLIPASDPITEQTKQDASPSSRSGRKWSVFLLFLIGVPILIYIAWYVNPKTAHAPKPANVPPVETQLAPAPYTSPESSVSPTLSPSPAATPELSPSASGADLDAPGVPAGRPATAPLAARASSSPLGETTPVPINTPDSTPGRGLSTCFQKLTRCVQVRERMSFDGICAGFS